MGLPTETEQAQQRPDSVTNNFVERDDILGGPAIAPQPVPEYHLAGPVHLEVIRAALEDRAEYGKPEDSIYYVPPKSPSVDNIEQLRQHRQPYLCNTPPDELSQPQYDLLQAYFRGIQQGAWDIILQLLNSGLVNANTTGVRLENGCTPLMLAVKAKQKKVMVLLLEHGALVDGWSGLTLVDTDLGLTMRETYPGLPLLERSTILRTPLMVAASQGDLSTVKWLMEGYGADDAIVAPDGQLALRLAADAGHEHVVAYLPVRRGGVYVRWRHKQARLLDRVGIILKHTGRIGKRILYDVPKWLIYDAPKWVILQLIVYPLWREVKWCWKNKHLFLPFVGRQITQFPQRVKRMMQKVARWALKLPTMIRKAALQTWQDLRSVARVIQRVIQRIPGALKIAWKYIMESVKTVCNAVQQVVERFLSLLHTAISAMATFFRDLTLANLITAVADLLEAIFVSLPIKMWHVAKRAWKTCYKIMERLFGLTGEVICWIGEALFRLIIFFPQQLFNVLRTFGEMVAVNWRELRVWWNPKAM